jgi:hypothetical protein
MGERVLNFSADTVSAVAVIARLEAAVVNQGEDTALRVLDAFNALLFPFTATPRVTDSGDIELVIAPSSVLLELLAKVEARNV